MGFPVTAKQIQGLIRQWHIAVLCALATVDEEHHPRTVNVRDLKVQRFLQSQTAGVDGLEEDEVVKGRYVGKGLVDGLRGQYFLKPFFLLYFDRGRNCRPRGNRLPAGTEPIARARRRRIQHGRSGRRCELSDRFRF